MLSRPHAGAAVLAAALLLLGALPRALPVQAATFVVTTTQDAPHSLPLNGSCTSTLGGSLCTLRAAVQAANFLGGTQMINLQAPGTYALTVTGANEDAAATGDLDVNGVNLTIANTIGGAVIIDGNATDRVFDVGPVAAAQLTVSGLTIQHGNPSANGAPGAGSRVARNSALTLTSVTVSGNTTTSNASGGGIYNLGTATLNNVTLSGNTANGGLGGGLENEGTATLTNVTISGNSVPGGSGGGIANYIAGQLMLTNVTLTGNSTPNTGGGISNYGTATLTNVTISNNQASVGGGIANGYAGPAGTISLLNATVYGNLGTTPANLLNAAGTVQLKNTIVAAAAGNPTANCQGPITSQGYNVDSSNTCGLSTANGDQINTNPQLGPLGNNGGPTQTHALLSGSPAIDAVQSGCPPPSTDQRGVSRPQGARCDVGAYEAQPPCSPRPNVGVAVTPAGSGRLQATLTANTNISTPTNALQTIQLTSATGALVRDGNDNPIAVPTIINLPANTTAFGFYIRKAVANQAATVSLTVTDACGPWPTFVGGGLSAFPPEPPPAVPTPSSPALARLSAPALTALPAATGPGSGATAPGQGASAAPPPATATPTPTPLCAPRPAIQVGHGARRGGAAARDADGRSRRARVPSCAAPRRRHERARRRGRADGPQRQHDDPAAAGDASGAARHPAGDGRAGDDGGARGGGRLRRVADRARRRPQCLLTAACTRGIVCA
jgi:CSLREA domain-containing protein